MKLTYKKWVDLFYIKGRYFGALCFLPTRIWICSDLPELGESGLQVYKATADMLHIHLKFHVSSMNEWLGNARRVHNLRREMKYRNQDKNSRHKMGDWLKLEISWRSFHLNDPDSRMEILTFFSICIVLTNVV